MTGMTWAIAALVGWLSATTIAGWVFNGIKALLDAIYPDSMPAIASSWLRGLLKVEWAKDVAVHRGPRNFNAFIPSGDAIVLDKHTYHKSDPFFWAIAAHEFGHVWLYRRLRLGWLFGNGRMFQAQSASLARVIFAVGVLFGAAHLLEATEGVLWVALAGGAIVLMDELLASAVAMVTLRRSGLSLWQMVGATVGLLFAFLTYVSGVVADGLILAYGELIWAQLDGLQIWSPAEGAPGLLRRIVLALSTLFLVLRIPVSLFAMVDGDLGLLVKEATIGQIATAVFLVFSFGYADTSTGQLLFCVGVLGGQQIFLLPFNTILGLVFVFTIGMTDLGKRMIKDAEALQQTLGAANILAYQKVMVARVLVTAAHLSAVPYVVWYWLSD